MALTLLLCKQICILKIHLFVISCLMPENHHGCVLVSKQDFKCHILSLQLHNYNTTMSVTRNIASVEQKKEAEMVSPPLSCRWVLIINIFFVLAPTRSSTITKCGLSTEGWCIVCPLSVYPFVSFIHNFQNQIISGLTVLFFSINKCQSTCLRSSRRTG